MDDDMLRQAETLFLDAATDPAAWQAALDMVVRASGSKGAAILGIEGRAPVALSTPEMDDLVARYLRDGWHLRDFRYAGVPQMKRTGIMVDQDFVAPEQMSRMDYYADFLQPMGFGWFTGLRVTTGDDDLWCLTLQRGVDSGAYLPEEQRSLVRLSDVVSRAATLARRLEFSRLEGAVDAADAMSGACFFIDSFARVVRMTAAAERMVGRDLQIRQGQIRLPHGSDALDRHLAASLWPDLAPDAAALRPLVVPRPGKRPLIFHAIRLRGHALGFLSPACVMVTVKDIEAVPRPDMETFGRYYDLTPSELRVAAALIERHGLVDAAMALGISYETARTHAKMLYAKSATANQVELADLISRFGSPAVR
jgi:DNA-binding CsgD family transcriptional regulator